MAGDLRSLLLTSAFCGLLLLSVILLRSIPLSRPLSAVLETQGGKPNISHSSDLDEILQQTAMPGKTLIITTLNEAWAKPNSMVDLFLQSFGSGKNISKYLDYLLIVALDQMSYGRCLTIHPHCYLLQTSGVDLSAQKNYNTPDYVTMMWTRIDFLRRVLEKGFDFMFTDTDILWFRDPFELLSADSDFQMACDYYVGDPQSLNNSLNGGFVYARANNKTVNFYKHWYAARKQFPRMHDQDVFNRIKGDNEIKEIGLKMHFFDTKYISCFCQRSDDFEKVVTMHADCCVGLQKKLHDLQLIFADWKRYLSANRSSSEVRWSAPKACR